MRLDPLAAVGITAFAWAVGAALLGWGSPVDTWERFAVAFLLPFAAAPLWGRKYGAGLVAAVAGLWILPAAAFGGPGYLIYMALERLARVSAWTDARVSCFGARLNGPWQGQPGRPMRLGLLRLCRASGAFILNGGCRSGTPRARPPSTS